VPAVAFRNQNLYCKGVRPPVAVAVQVTGVPTATGEPGAAVTDVIVGGAGLEIAHELLFDQASQSALDPADRTHT
jgi:hypothetical protein